VECSKKKTNYGEGGFMFTEEEKELLISALEGRIEQCSDNTWEAEKNGYGDVNKLRETENSYRAILEKVKEA
jgi:hypothetical protein